MSAPPHKPVTPPLDLLDENESWCSFRSFRDYVAALRSQPPATNCALLVGHTMLRLQTMDNVERPAAEGEVKAHARARRQRPRRRRHRHLDRSLLRAGARRVDRGG